VLAYDSEDGYLTGPADFTGTAGEAWMDRFLLQTATGWRSVSYLYPNPGQWEERVPAEVLADLEGLDAELIVTGTVPVFGEISSYVQREFIRLTLLALCTVLLISLVFFRRPLVSLLSVVPALVGLVWTLGLMQILGVELNLVSMLVAPMILGLGIDDALHVLNRNEESPGELEVSMASVSRGILMTSLTTLIGFGSLALSSLPSLQSLGITVSIGMVCCAVTSLVLLPALLRAFDSRS
jgi:hypothetical protein